MVLALYTYRQFSQNHERDNAERVFNRLQILQIGFRQKKAETLLYRQKSRLALLATDYAMKAFKISHDTRNVAYFNLRRRIKIAKPQLNTLFNDSFFFIHKIKISKSSALTASNASFTHVFCISMT